MKRPSLSRILVIISVLGVAGDSHSQGNSYTGIVGYWDYQTSYRTPQYLRVCAGSDTIHAVMMVSDDSLDPSASRRTAYAFSSDDGASWTTFNQIRVPVRKSGFPSLDIGQGVLACMPIVANHNSGTNGTQSWVYIDSPPGTGVFTELPPPPLFGGFDEPGFPEVAGAADGSVILVGSRFATGSAHYTRTGDFLSWQPWGVVTLDLINDDFVAEANSSGNVGIAYTNPEGPLYWLESTDNGVTWPASATQLLPDLFLSGNDTFAVQQGLDLAYLEHDTLITFGVTRVIDGLPSPSHHGIGFWSESSGFVLAVPHDSIPGVIDAMNKPQVNQNPVGFPAIGVSGSTLVIVFQAYRSDTSQSGFNYGDIFLTYSSNGGSTWSHPQNLTQTPSLDERYPSVSKWNAPGTASMVFQEDPQPGSAVFGGDNSPVALLRQRFYRYSGLPTGVSDQSINLPRSLTLEQNYPNPFNPSTTIRFDLPQTSHATLRVFDILGRAVATLADEVLSAGQHSRVFDGSNLGGGVYFYTVRASNQSVTRKLMFLK